MRNTRRVATLLGALLPGSTPVTQLTLQVTLNRICSRVRFKAIRRLIRSARAANR